MTNQSPQSNPYPKIGSIVPNDESQNKAVAFEHSNVGCLVRLASPLPAFCASPMVLSHFFLNLGCKKIIICWQRCQSTNPRWSSVKTSLLLLTNAAFDSGSNRRNRENL